MTKGGLERKTLLLRLFATSVMERATRVMLVLRMRNGVSVVVRSGLQLQSASVVIWFVSTVTKKVTLVRSASSLRRLKLVEGCLLLLVHKQRMRIV